MELLYITNEIIKAIEAEKANIDYIFIDTEINGKYKRQGHLDTVISKHTLEDIIEIKKNIKNSKILTRINPFFQGTCIEVETALKYGTDAIMLPMFKTKEEVENFVNIVNGRAEVWLLLETSQALVRIDDILEVKGIDRIHIGLNDLHLSLGLDFMFECLSSGVVEYLIDKIRQKNIKYGIGGIARIGDGELNAELILSEHVRLKSESVILSRTFKRESEDLKKDVDRLRQKYNDLSNQSIEYLLENKQELKNKIKKIVSRIKEKKKI